MSDAARTFDALWATSGSVVSTHRPDETLRGRVSDSVGARALPHLTIGEDGASDGPQLEIRGLLGEGGMGVVHVARQDLLDRDVAIKRLRPGAGEGAAQALLREARYMGSLEHPNVVPVHALGADDAGHPVIVMKRIEGVSWRTLLANAQHVGWEGWPDEDDPLARNVQVLRDVCKAVAFAHARGVVHRDLKPDNVLVGPHGEVYVLDWGIAARVDQPAPGGLVGTPAYMPPEMARSAAVKPTMDVYLLGGCLFEVLSGRPPHPGDTVQEVLAAAFAGTIGALPDTEPELAAICRRALDADPDARWPSVQALQRALDRWWRSQGLRRVVEAAQARLEGLGRDIAEGADPRKVHDGVAACRFGFGQALDAEPDRTDARAGLEAALRLAAGYALERERLDEAETLLHELVDRGFDASELEQRLRTARAAREATRALAAELDLGVAAVQRAAILLVTGLVGVAITAYLLVTTTRLDASTPFFIGLAFSALVGAGTALAWPWLRQNAINRGLAGTLIAGVIIIDVHRAIAWANDLPAWLTLSTDLLILTMFAVTAGLLVARMALVFALAAAVGAVGCAVFPEHAATWFGVSTTVGFLAAAGLGYRQR